MEQKLDKPTLELEKKKHRSRLMYLGGIGCLLLLVLLLALGIIFFNLVVKLLAGR